MRHTARILLLVCVAALAQAQLFTLTKDQLIELTTQNPFPRFPDGRPKVPDSVIERAKEMSAEEVWAILGRGNNAFRNQPWLSNEGECLQVNRL